MKPGAIRMHRFLALLGRCADRCAWLLAPVVTRCRAALAGVVSMAPPKPAKAANIVGVFVVACLLVVSAEIDAGWSTARAAGGSTLPRPPPPPPPQEETPTPAAPSPPSTPAMATPSPSPSPTPAPEAPSPSPTPVPQGTPVPEATTAPSPTPPDGGERPVSTPTPDGGEKPLPTPLTSPEPARVVTGSSENPLVLTSIDLSREASAATADGEPLRVLPGTVAFRERGAGAQEVVLPVALPSNLHLGAFADPSAGILWDPADGGGTLTTRLDSETGPIEMVVRLGPVEGSGLQARADVRWVRIRAGPWPDPLPGSPVLGVAVEVALPAAPPELWFSMRYVDPSPAFSQAIGEAAAAGALGSAGVETAFELSSNIDVDSAPVQIELTVDPAWMELGARSRVRLAGLAGGEVALFPLAAAPSPPGTTRLVSPPVGEHSRYAVVLLSDESAPAEQPADGRGFDWTATALAIVGGLFAAAALALFVRSRRLSR